MGLGTLVLQRIRKDLDGRVNQAREIRLPWVLQIHTYSTQHRYSSAGLEYPASYTPTGLQDDSRTVGN